MFCFMDFNLGIITPGCVGHILILIHKVLESKNNNLTWLNLIFFYYTYFMTKIIQYLLL